MLTGARSRWGDPAAETMLMQRMDLAVTEVCAAVHSRTEARVDAARKAAADLRTIAHELRDLMAAHKEIDLDSAPGDLLVPMFRSLVRIRRALDEAAPSYRRFFEEHATIIEPEVRTTINAFRVFLRDTIRRVRPAYDRFVAEYLARAEAGASRSADVARLWSAVDADGLDVGGATA